jgi:hypothetical protein
MTARLVRRNYGRGHSYQLDGHKVDGVTTAISTGFPVQLKQWSADVAANYAIEHWDELAEQPLTKRIDRIRYAHRETLAAAALRGTEIHGYGEKLVHGIAVEIPDDYRGPSEAYARFVDEWRIEPIATETPLANTEYGYGGTADLWATIGVRGGLPALIDLKTGANIYESVALQLAAYRHADLWQPRKGEETTDVPKVEAVYVAHILPDDVRLLPIEADDNAFREFLYVLMTARWIDRHGFRGEEPVIGAPERIEGIAS